MAYRGPFTPHFVSLPSTHTVIKWTPCYTPSVHCTLITPLRNMYPQVAPAIKNDNWDNRKPVPDGLLATSTDEKVFEARFAGQMSLACAFWYA